MKGGFEHKLLSPYRITKKDDGDVILGTEPATGGPSQPYEDQHLEHNDSRQLLPLQQMTTRGNDSQHSLDVETQRLDADRTTSS